MKNSDSINILAQIFGITKKLAEESVILLCDCHKLAVSDRSVDEPALRRDLQLVVWCDLAGVDCPVTITGRPPGGTVGIKYRSARDNLNLLVFGELSRRAMG